ncbi:MAG: HlyD family type I secretion periplasmic adaptor subunit [Coxiellaceae bacterium]|nr:HlyD family type I secretion periplasmic adaptor subunit [Coxiellaceae bacterium]
MMWKKLTKLIKWKKRTLADEFMEGFSSDPSNIGRSRHYLLIGCLLLICILFLWAFFAEIDVVTSGQGKVIPSGKVQVIQHLEGGIVSKMLIREGDKVKKGQTLAVIDDINYTSLYKNGLLKTAALKARVARLAAEANGTPFDPKHQFSDEFKRFLVSEKRAYEANQRLLNNRIQSYKHQLKQRQEELEGLEARKKKLLASLKIVDEEYGMTKRLHEQGAAARVEVLRLQRQQQELKGDLDELKQNADRTDSSILEAINRVKESRVEFRSHAIRDLVLTKAELASQEETNITLRDRSTRTSLKSPVNGIVHVIYINTIGGIVRPGEKILEIVPSDDTLLVEAKIKPRDIAFIHPGQKATISLTAYDFITYGGLQGIVKHISADTITDPEDNQTYYLIKVKTDKDHLGTKEKPLPIIAGMTAEVDILTGKKTILNYILKPLQRGSQKALRER